MNYELGVLIVCNTGATIGLGHLKRMLALAQALNRMGVMNIHFLIFGEFIKSSELEGFDFNFVSENKDFSSELLMVVNIELPKVLVFDLHPKFINQDLEDLLCRVSKKHIYLVGVDSLSVFTNKLDLTWVPSFYKPPGVVANKPGSVFYGWNTYLIQKRLKHASWDNGKKLLVLTGGSDLTGLGKELPTKIDNQLSGNLEIHWVQGPFATDPNLPANPRLKWVLHKSVENLDALIVNCNYAITVFGVALFELLQYGIPTVVFSPYNGKDDTELLALEKENVAIISKNDETAVKDLIYLMENEKLAISISQNAISKLSVNGANNLAEKIASVLE